MIASWMYRQTRKFECQSKWFIWSLTWANHNHKLWSQRHRLTHNYYYYLIFIAFLGEQNITFHSSDADNYSLNIVKWSKRQVRERTGHKQLEARSWRPFYPPIFINRWRYRYLSIYLYEPPVMSNVKDLYFLLNREREKKIYVNDAAMSTPIYRFDSIIYVTD